MIEAARMQAAVAEYMVETRAVSVKRNAMKKAESDHSKAPHRAHPWANSLWLRISRAARARRHCDPPGPRPRSRRAVFRPHLRGSADVQCVADNYHSRSSGGISYRPHRQND